MSARPVRLGTRGSPLALVQAELTIRAMATARPALRDHIDVIVFETRGDQRRDCPIEHIGGRGVFTDELDRAVAQGDVDFAVHSVKDLPVPLAGGLLLAATLERADPREAFVSTRHASLAAVPRGGTMGSASLRREALVKALRPDLDFALLRGNVEERVAALDRRGLDGTILAVAGLARLGLQRHIREILSPETLMPDPGQGAIGLVCRGDNLVARALAARINHAATLQAVTAERAFLAIAGGRFVVGALAVVSGSTLTLSASAALPGGPVIWRESSQGPAETPVAVAQKLAAALPAVAVRGERA
ncbi:MAG: hydroxymethylbilane synthase [Rhodospirillaceae bacterium]|nr:hydroxymethylbilane synthase [Rhodospirillaceae bacterium]